MSDFLSTLKNPWVLGAGVTLGLIVLMMRGGGQAGGSDGNAGDSAYIGAMNSYGTAVVNANAQIQVANSGATAQMVQSVLGWIQNSQAVSAAQQVSNAQIFAGVQQTQNNNMTSYLIEANDNLARNAATYAQADTANRQTAAAIRIADINAGAALGVAHQQASAAKFSAVAGGISSVLTGGLKLLAGGIK